MLTLLTLVEFAIAFAVDKEGAAGTARTIIFVVMTIIKAFYIVAFFMHLKFERVHLIYTIVLPMAFIVYLILLMFNEAGAVHVANHPGN